MKTLILLIRIFFLPWLVLMKLTRKSDAVEGMLLNVICPVFDVLKRRVREMDKQIKILEKKINKQR